MERSEEDWGWLCNPTVRGGDFWDPIKYVRLGARSGYLSLGGELRGSYQFYRNYNWGVGPQDDNGYYLNRFIGHADIHFSRPIRIFAELQSGLESGRNGGPRPSIDEDKLDLSQLFLELYPVNQRHKLPIVVRFGRQELNYGEGTLVSIRELNVRRPFDGVKVTLLPSRWRIDVFAAKPVVTQGAAFDDRADSRQTFWGVWATRLGASLINRLDLYYLGLDRKAARFEQGTARERRNTLGFNLHEKIGKFMMVQEGDFQIGAFGDGRLAAWKVAQLVTYAPAIRLKPTFTIQGAISSGDRSSMNIDLQTFHPLFPKGLYYGYMPFTSGSLNAIVVHPGIAAQLSRSLSLSAESFFLWRQQKEDGLYSPPGSFLRSVQGSDERYIGWTQDLNLLWQVDRHTAVQFLAAYYEVGPYLRETDPEGRNAAYLSITMSYKF